MHRLGREAPEPSKQEAWKGCELAGGQQHVARGLLVATLAAV
jgi:hypothetical protein